jgi:hypothetical protein
MVTVDDRPAAARMLRSFSSSNDSPSRPILTCRKNPF